MAPMEASHRHFHDPPLHQCVAIRDGPEFRNCAIMGRIESPIDDDLARHWHKPHHRKTDNRKYPDRHSAPRATRSSQL